MCRVSSAVSGSARPTSSTASPATRCTSNGIKEPSYNTWNVGVGFTYKVFTLDLRYSDTDLSKGNCNAFTSDFSAANSSTGFVTPINRRDAARRSAPTGAARPASPSSRST